MAPLLLDLTEVFLFALSATRFSRMTATVLEVPRLDPIISDEKTHLLKPGPAPAKIIYERSQVRPLFFYFLVAHAVSPFTLNMGSTVPRFGGPDA